MASYTMQLRTYIEMFSQNESIPHRERIEKARSKLFDFSYPLFDSKYKKTFETNFIRHFYMREIGFETEELFKFQLETWLNIHMPYFNQLFQSELIKYDPLINSKLDVTHNKKNDRNQHDNRDNTQHQNVDTKGNQKDTEKVITDQTAESTTGQDSTANTVSNKTESGSTTNDDFNRQLDSNNPDSRLTITTNDGQGVIEYASSIMENNANNKETTTGKVDETVDQTSSVDTLAQQTANEEKNLTGNRDTTGNEVADRKENDKYDSDVNENEDFIQHQVGKIGTLTYPEMVTEFRKSFLRIEKEIFEEMQELFMGVY